MKICSQFRFMFMQKIDSSKEFTNFQVIGSFKCQCLSHDSCLDIIAIPEEYLSMLPLTIPSFDRQKKYNKNVLSFQVLMNGPHIQMPL